MRSLNNQVPALELLNDDGNVKASVLRQITVNILSEPILITPNIFRLVRAA